MADGIDGAALQRIGQAADFLLGRQFVAAGKHVVAHTVALGQQQNLLLRQFVLGNGIEFFKRMPFGHDDEKRFVIQRLGQKACFLKRLGNDDGVQIAALERFGQHVGVILFQHQRHIRRNFTQRQNQLGQKIRRDGENQAEFERAVQFILLFAGQLADNVSFIQNTPRLRHDTPARFGGDNLIAAAVEQRECQLFFQLLYRNRKRGLADMAALGGPAEMPFLRNGNNVTQFGQCHGLCLFLLVRQGDVQLQHVQAVLFFLRNADIVKRNVHIFRQHFQQFFLQGGQIVGSLGFDAFLSDDNLQAVAGNFGRFLFFAEQYIDQRHINLRTNV